MGAFVGDEGVDVLFERARWTEKRVVLDLAAQFDGRRLAGRAEVHPLTLPPTCLANHQLPFLK